MKATRSHKLKNMGPGAFVTAAFIGPGTVTACTLAGAGYGYTLLWALLFATVATVILQEMSARLGLISGRGLGENLRDIFDANVFRWPLYVLIIAALYMGNAAYEAGNISGAALGLEAVFNLSTRGYRIVVIMIAVTAAAMIMAGSYKLIERMLITLVCIMALSFISSFVVIRPDLGALFAGLVTPRLPQGSLMTVIALIGTTIVPYNLFLHAATVAQKSLTPEDLAAIRLDSAVSIGLGGMITLLIAATAAASLFNSGLIVRNAGDMAVQLEPVFGAGAKYMLGIGFFAAGLSSAVTAPLATSYAMTELLGRGRGVGSPLFKVIALSVIGTGAALALTGIKPITIILSAQFANGLLLPIIAIVLLWVMNRVDVLGCHINGWRANTMGLCVVGVTTVLGARSILLATGLL